MVSKDARLLAAYNKRAGLSADLEYKQAQVHT